MKRPALSHQIFWGVASLNAANLIAMAMGFLQQIVLVRRLGLGQFGSLQIAIAAFDLTVAFFDFNLYLSAIRFGGEALGRGDRERHAEVFSAALQARITLCLLLLLCSVGAWAVGVTYEGARLGLPFVLLAGNYLFASLLGYVSTLFSVDKRFGVVSILNAITSIALSSAMMGAAWLRPSIVSVLTAQTAASCLVAIVALAVVRDRIYLRRVRWSVFREVGLFAGQVAISSIMKRILGKTDVLIVGWFLTSREVGLYRVAQSFASPIYTAIGPLWNVLFPVVAELSGRREYGKIVTLMLRGGRYLTIAALPCAALGSLLLAPFLHLAYGVDAPEAVSASMLLLWASAYSVAATVLPPILRVFRNDVATGYAILATAFNVLLDLLLVPHLGIIGCGVSTLLTMSLGGVVVFVFSYRLLRRLSPGRGGTGFMWFHAAAIPLIVAAFLRLHLVTALGAIAMLVAALGTKMISWNEVVTLVRDLRPRRAEVPSP